MDNKLFFLKPFLYWIKNIIWLLGLNAFLLILFIIFIELFLGGIVFYKYVFLAQRQPTDTTLNTVKFNNDAFEKVEQMIFSNEQHIYE